MSSLGRRGKILGEGGVDMMMIWLQGSGGKYSGGEGM